ncbi:hypothetical protein [Nonomuraea insulae]|uniref:Uncharacterized protein n=1 Tax=Nonomuraea insulae TaxID=1616787 RepID=A0ABW1D5E5_9ACTN
MRTGTLPRLRRSALTQAAEDGANTATLRLHPSPTRVFPRSQVAVVAGDQVSDARAPSTQ